MENITTKEIEKKGKIKVLEVEKPNFSHNDKEQYRVQKQQQRKIKVLKGF